MWDSKVNYWPQEGYQNSLPERNLSIHLAHKLLDSGWVVFAEASFPNRTNRRIDLIGIKNDVLIITECKQLDMADRAQEYAGDLMDIRKFTLTAAWDTADWSAPKIRSRYGILLATTWSKDVKDWWLVQRKLSPDNHTGSGWKKLGKKLELVRTNSRALFKGYWLTRSDVDDSPNYWALYAVFKLPRK